MTILGGSPGLAYPSSRMTSATIDWPITGTDPIDDYWREAGSIANRSWHLWRSNSYGRAVIRSLVELALGPHGLIPRSMFRGDVAYDDSDPNQVQALADVRRSRSAIEKSLRYAWRDTRFDATGTLTKYGMSAVMLLSCICAGDAWAIRQWKPNRPGRQYQGTCWRVIDPARVSNPNFGANTATLYEGIQQDADGCPIGIWVQNRNPYAVQRVDYTWTYVPWYDEDGRLNVVHLNGPCRPDQLRATGWLDAVMGHINQLGGVTDAYVMAKRVQACLGIIWEFDQPGPASNSLVNGAVSTNPTGSKVGKMTPGMQPIVPKGTKATVLNWNFNGQDHSEFSDSLLTAICSAVGLPMEYVQHRLTKSNMASARAALMQAYRTGHIIQEMMIAQVETPWAESVIAEDIVRDRLVIDTSDLDDVYSLRWNRPSRAFPDPVREMTGLQLKKQLGVSPAQIFAEMGLDHEHEIMQGHQDRAFEKSHGWVDPLAPAAAAPGVAASPCPVCGSSDHRQCNSVDGGTPTVVVAPVPYLSGQSTDGTITYIDPVCPKTWEINGKGVDVYAALQIHEKCEWSLMTRDGLSYDDAHFHATLAEHMFLATSAGLTADELVQYEAWIRSLVDKSMAAGLGAPDDIYTEPYLQTDGGAALLRPRPTDQAKPPGSPIYDPEWDDEKQDGDGDGAQDDSSVERQPVGDTSDDGQPKGNA